MKVKPREDLWSTFYAEPNYTIGKVYETIMENGVEVVESNNKRITVKVDGNFTKVIDKNIVGGKLICVK